MSRSVHFSRVTSISKVLAALLLAAGCSGNNGAAGPPGPPGTNGTSGTSCAVTDNHDGTSTLRCTDGTSTTVTSGSTGSDGASCTLVNNGDGTRTITCGGDAGVVTVPDAVIDFTPMTDAEKKEAAMSAVITSVTFPADGRPLVTIKVSERHGYGVKSLAVAPITWRFSLLKLTPGVNSSANDTWVSYLAANDHSSASSETALPANLTDYKDGTYTYRFAKVINAGGTAAGTTYEPDKVHRLIVLLYSSGNPFTPINLVKELIPATGADVTGQNDKVDGKACLECHTTFRAIAGGTGELGGGEFHGGVRYDVNTCVACHNDQRRFTSTGTPVTEPGIAPDGTWTGNAGVINGEAVINLPVFIHKIHMGNKLALTGGTYAGIPDPFEITYPQDVRNCVKCHRAPAPKADNWKTQPSRRACGACHDGKSFAATTPPARTPHAVTNINPNGFPQADDSMCKTCHAAGALVGDVGSSHLTISDPNPHNTYADATATGNANTNAAFVAAAGAVPTGAKVVTYLVKSVSTWTDSTSGTALLRPQIVFKFQLDGVDVVFPNPTTATELIPNFVGSPSAYFVFAVPEDTKVPSDFNATASAYLRNIWNSTGTCSNAASTTTRTGAGTLTGPDAAGYYTVQLSCAIIPANATMLTGGIGYTYGLGARQNPVNPDLDFINNTQPLTQINLPAYPYVTNKKADGVTAGYAGRGGLIVPPHDISMVASGYTGRRAIVENARCGSCHVALGVGPDFHAGQRNDAPTCSWCHNPNLTSSGWSANTKDFIHAIHGAEKRTTNFTWHQASATEGFWKTTYPGVLNQCEMCHLPGTYDFSASATIAAYPNMLPSTVAKGTYAAGSVHPPYVNEGQNYGAAFTFAALTGVATGADPTTLVVSPIVAACSACHDSPIAVDHMQTNGGSFYEPRAVVFAKPQQEQCLLCHGPGRLASIAERHRIQP